MPIDHLFGREALRIESLRIRVNGRIVMDGVDGDLDGDTGRNDQVGVGHGVIRVSHTIDDGQGWVFAEGF